MNKSDRFGGAVLLLLFAVIAGVVFGACSFIIPSKRPTFGSSHLPLDNCVCLVVLGTTCYWSITSVFRSGAEQVYI